MLRKFLDFSITLSLGGKLINAGRSELSICTRDKAPAPDRVECWDQTLVIPRNHGSAQIVGWRIFIFYFISYFYFNNKFQFIKLLVHLNAKI